MKRAVILLLLLTSCGQQEGQTSKSSTNDSPNAVLKCIDGASYEVIDKSAFLRIKDGKYIPC